MIFLKAVIPLVFICVIRGSFASTRFVMNTSNNLSDLFKTRNNNLKITVPIAVTKSPLHVAKSNPEDDIPIMKDNTNFKRSSFIETSTFNPDVLNKFLEEYAFEIKSTTEKNYKYPFTVVNPSVESLGLNVVTSNSENLATNLKGNISTEQKTSIETILRLEDIQTGILNDTLERNKHWGNNFHKDRNGWVTLEAIPWSKSKISKWQANQNTQRPWPEREPWSKPQPANSWSTNPPISPSHNSIRPLHDEPKPHWVGNAVIQKPLYVSDRPNPDQPTRSSYFHDNKFDYNPTNAQKWPPEKPWDKYSDNSYKQGSDIITDERPSNFPDNPSSFQNSWNNPSQISESTYGYDRYPESGLEDDRNEWKTHNYNFPTKFEELNNRPSNSPKPSSFDRPHFSQYHYPPEHPPSHPSNGDGQWVLLSTNRGYSKSRQRSIKIQASNSEPLKTMSTNNRQELADPTIAVMTSKRQVRLTVLPSVNGTNTTTSHGGLLEVEKTFKTVDQSQKDYERDKKATAYNNRPIQNTVNRQPSNSAVLAAVGAGMLPATMAMVIPMMLGRRKRATKPPGIEHMLQKSDFENELENLADKLNNQRRINIFKM